MCLMKWKPVAVFVFLLSLFWPQRTQAFTGISSLSPTAGPVGTVVSVTGASFGTAAGTVTFNGTQAAILSWSNNNVVVRVPSGASTGSVALTAPGGGPVTGPTFTVTAGTPGSGYGFRRAITIDHTKVSNTDQTNFPFLISGTYAYLATTGNGGNVTNSNGYDVIFTSDAGGTTGLPYERESYSPTTGQVNLWVQIPNLSHTTDTVIYMFYGNSSVTTDQSNGPAVWDLNYVAVYHLGDNTSTTTVSISTATLAQNGIAAVNTNTKAASGEIDGALNFNGTSDSITVPQNGSNGPFNFHASPFTISGWMKDDTSASILDNPKHRVFSWYDGTKNIQLGFSSAASETTRVIYFFDGTSSSSISAATTGNLSTGYHYVVGTFDGTSTLHIYIDGTQQDGGTFDGGVTTFTANSTTLYLGQLGSNADYVNGQLDEIRISSSIRSADWTLTEYRNQSSPGTFYSIGSTSAGGSVAYVQSQTKALGSAGNISATFAAQPAAGNTIVVGDVCYGPSGCPISSVTDNFGNTYSKIGPTATYGGPTANITNVVLYCATGIATGGSFTVTVAQGNSSGGDSNLYIAEYSGASCNVDQSASGSLTGGTATTLLQTASTPTTTNASDLLVAVGGASTGGTATAGTAFTLRQNGSGVAEYGGFEDRVVSATGAYSGSMTLSSTTTYWAMVIVALNGSSSGHGGPVITSLSAVGGPGGSTLTLTGTFGATQGTVLFQNADVGGNTNASITSWSSTSIVVTVPSTLPIGLFNVQVVNSAGASNTEPFWITGAGCPTTW